jgi:DNA gyrase subunit A
MTEHDHQIEAIAAGAQHLLRRCQERFHLLGALLKAIDEAEAVQALIHASESAEAAQPRLMDLLDIDLRQARVVLDLQWRRLASTERRNLADEYQQLAGEMTEYEAILASADRQRELVGTERGELLASQA